MKNAVKSKKAEKRIVFLDFDNTITIGDVLDDMLERYSVNLKWQELEKRWKERQIGSRECLEGQIKGIRITKSELDRYLSGIKIDPYFKVLLKYLRARKIKTFIVSDNFDYILRRILKNNRVALQDIYANRFRFDKNRLRPSFPYSNPRCGDCAHCKQTTVKSNSGRASLSMYVGDGQSDICAAQDANIVFAKDSLKKYFRKERLPHVAISGLKDVYRYLKKSE